MADSKGEINTMGRFDRNRSTQIEQEIDKNVRYPRIGEVTQVYEHIGKEDDSNFEADVVTGGGTEQEQRCPIEMPGSGGIDIPKVGDKVILSYRKDGDKPFISAIAYSDEDRPPVGRAGMFRREFESGQSPAGDGNLYLTGHTKYNLNPAISDKDVLDPESVLVRIAKRKNEIAEPTTEDDVPAKFEFYDSPDEGEAYITVEINKDDEVDSTGTWGMKFDIANGTIKLVDPEGFGIEASGDGDFTWHHKSIDFNEVEGFSGPLSL
jgi:hypothetical protein